MSDIERGRPAMASSTPRRRRRIALVYPHSVIPVPAVRVSDALAIVVWELARRLARRHEVTVYTRRGPGMATEERHEGVTWRRVPVGLDRALNSLKALDRLGITGRDRPFRMTGLYYLPFALRVARDMRRRGCEIVHLHSVMTFLPLFRRLCPEAGLLFHAHDHVLADFAAPPTLERLRDADRVLACSGFVSRNVAQRFPSVADRCRPLHNGVDKRFLSVEADPARSRRVLFVGRVSPEKGVHLLIEATRAAVEAGVDLSLDIVGPVDLAPKQFVDPHARDPALEAVAAFYGRPGAWLAHLQDLARPLGERVRFLGPVDNDRLAEHQARAGLFAFPSVWQEPFGIPVIEAMAAGLPVVASRAGAFPETVVDGETGLLVERGSARDLARALTLLLEDPERRSLMGAHGRARVAERFTWDGVVDRLEEQYEEALEHRRNMEEAT